MGLKAWWKRYRLETVQYEVDDMYDEFIQEKEQTQSYHQIKKQAAHKYLPHKSDDVLAQKQGFINACSAWEEEFQKDYISLSNNEHSRLKSKISRDKVQEARLIAQIKWRRMLSHIR